MSEWKPPEGAEVIVCAAIRLNDTVICGARHYDSIMHKQIRVSELHRLHWFNNKHLVEQGFIDQFGRFYSRTEAWKVATAKGQIKRRCCGDEANGGTLFSENLY